VHEFTGLGMIDSLCAYAMPGLWANIEAVGMLVTIGVRLLEFLFAVGVIGSAIVLILTAIEDLETLLGSDESARTEG
jgi:hypothetical protein